MTIVYFDELKESKKILLEMGEMDNNNILKLEEAKFLLNQMKLYYLHSKSDDEKQNLLACFNKTPDQFKHMDLIKQVEKDNLKVEQFKS